VEQFAQILASGLKNQVPTVPNSFYEQTNLIKQTFSFDRHTDE